MNEIDDMRLVDGDWFTETEKYGQSVQHRAIGGGRFNGDKLEMIRQKLNEIIDRLNSSEKGGE